MEHGHAAPISTLALAVTLTVGAILAAPDAHAAPATASHATAQTPRR
jgi:hypothetical protein